MTMTAILFLPDRGVLLVEARPAMPGRSYGPCDHLLPVHHNPLALSMMCARVPSKEDW